jgi:hypothetical protein
LSQSKKQTHLNMNNHDMNNRILHILIENY